MDSGALDHGLLLKVIALVPSKQKKTLMSGIEPLLYRTIDVLTTPLCHPGTAAAFDYNLD